MALTFGNLRLLATGLTCLALVACSSEDRLARPLSAEDARQASAAANLEYRLDSGDQLRVKVFREEDLSGEFEIDGSGMISLPLIGEVSAAGKTLRQLEDAVEQMLAEGYLREPQVSVEVMNYRPFYILGEVNRPGSYPYRAGMTVLNAVALAGGFTYRAKKSEIRVTRRGDRSGMDLLVTPASSVLPGDIVKVPERFF